MIGLPFSLIWRSGSATVRCLIYLINLIDKTKSLLACENSHLFSLLAGRGVSPGETSAPQRQKFHTDDVKSVLKLVRSSDYLVLDIVYEWQTKDKRPQSSNVNAMNLLQNSPHLLNIFFFWRSIWVLLELVRRRNQNFTNIDQEKPKIEQI